MVWLFVPESEALNSVSLLPSPSTDVSVTWKGKLMQPASLSSAWKKGGWIRHLSGMTLKPSMANNGVVSLILSLRASHASRGQPLGNNRALRTNGGYGATSPRSYARWHPPTSSWRMFQASLEGEPVTFSETWPRWGSMRNGVCSVQPAWEPHTLGGDCSHWPTPTVMDPSYSPEQFKNRMKKLGGKNRGVYLSDAVRYWPTPQASDWKDKSHSRDYTLGNPKYIWPTPLAHDAKDVGTAAESKRHSPNLSWRVKMHPTPTAADADRHSATYQGGNPTLMGSAGGKLNPNWVEWLMGWPIGWTGSEPLATESYQQWRQQHIMFSVGG